MKNYLFLFAFIISAFLLPASVLAVDFSIENTEIHAYLLENGGVNVTEEHTYQFDGEFNGITRTLIPKQDPPAQIENVQALENGESLKVEQEEYLYKIYRGGSDETITIDLTYTIKNGVERYTDLGQFYWPFFDENNESTYLNMDIYIHPPHPTDEVIAFGYDEAQDSFRSETDGVVHFALGEVEDGENGDIRVAYDASLFPGASVIGDKTIREEIIGSQTELEEKKLAFENRKKLFSEFAPYVIGALTLFLLVLLLVARRKKKMTEWEVERNSFAATLIPKEEMSLPATILYMKPTCENGELLTAALLDLVRKGFIKRKDEDYFVVVDTNTEHEHESFLIDWLFYKVGINGQFSLSDLEKYIEKKQNHPTYQKDFSEWLRALKAEMENNHLVEKKKSLRLTIGNIGLFLLPTAIVLAVHELVMWMFLTLLLGIAFIVFSIVYRPRTEKGVRIKQQWQKMSDRFAGIQEKEWNEWMSNEQMKAFIYAIGTGNKSILQKNETFAQGLSSSSQAGFNTSSTDMFMLMIIAGTMTNQLKKADHTVHAASTDGATSFSGGGGVGGGGGGSGAF